MMKRICVIFFLSVIFQQVSAQRQDTLSDSQKLFGLSHFWKEASYNYAYFSNVPQLNWDSAYEAFIPQVLATTNTYEYYRVLQRFCALLKDGHTNVWFPPSISSQRVRRSFGDIRLELKNIDGKAIVINTANGTSEIIPVGSEIISVNDRPVASYINQEVRPFISQSAAYIIEDYCVDYLLDGFLGDTVRIGFKKPGSNSIHSRLLKREVKADVTWKQAYVNTMFGLTWLPGSVAKLDLNSFDDGKIVDTFLTVLPSLKKAKGIIIDLRLNGGGNSGYAAAILSYFTNEDSIRGSRWMTREHRGAFKAWGYYAMEDTADKSDWTIQAKNFYNGNAWYTGDQMTQFNRAPKEQRMPAVPLVVLLGHGTASAAEDFLIMLDGLPGRAITVGQRSFASTGQPLPIKLPGGGSGRICTKRDTYPDGRVFVGTGIIPSVEINPTLQDYLTKKDAALEKAITLLAAKK